MAINKHNLEMVQLLVEYGANINETLRNGTHIITYAAKQHKTDIVSYLKSKGANTEVEDIMEKKQFQDKKLNQEFLLAAANDDREAVLTYIMSSTSYSIIRERKN